MNSIPSDIEKIIKDIIAHQEINDVGDAELEYLYDYDYEYIDINDNQEPRNTIIKIDL